MYYLKGNIQKKTEKKTGKNIYCILERIMTQENYLTVNMIF